jgi:hypothetical protein
MSLKNNNKIVTQNSFTSVYNIHLAGLFVDEKEKRVKKNKKNFFIRLLYIREPTTLFFLR